MPVCLGACYDITWLAASYSACVASLHLALRPPYLDVRGSYAFVLGGGRPASGGIAPQSEPVVLSSCVLGLEQALSKEVLRCAGPFCKPNHVVQGRRKLLSMSNAFAFPWAVLYNHKLHIRGRWIMCV